MKFNRGDVLNIPNYISLVRIGAVPVLAILLMLIRSPEVAHPSWNAFISFITALVYGVASFSDMLDGYIARKYNYVSTTGKFLDPLADKLLNLAALILLIPLGRMPAWLVVLILVREIGITALRSMAASEQIIISASKWGKYKSAFGSFGVAFLILHYPFLGINWVMIGWVFILISVVFSMGSGAHYVYNFIKEVKRREVIPEMVIKEVSQE